jgi:hypothetical protein
LGIATEEVSEEFEEFIAFQDCLYIWMVCNCGCAHRPSWAPFTSECVHDIGAGLENVVFSAVISVFKDRTPPSDHLFSVY